MEAAMSWMYSKQLRAWKLSIGIWNATVRRLQDSDAWYGIVERAGTFAERYESEDLEWPQEARVWCEQKIAELRSRK
jgi:hypothetical protein